MLQDEGDASESVTHQLDLIDAYSELHSSLNSCYAFYRNRNQLSEKVYLAI